MMDVKALTKTKEDACMAEEKKYQEYQEQQKKFASDKEKFYKDLDNLAIEGLEEHLTKMDDQVLEKIMTNLMKSSYRNDKKLKFTILAKTPYISMNRYRTPVLTLAQYFEYGGISEKTEKHLPYNNSVTIARTENGISDDFMTMDECQFSWDDFWLHKWGVWDSKIKLKWRTYYMMGSDENTLDRYYTAFTASGRIGDFILFNLYPRYLYKWAIENDIKNKLLDRLSKYGMEVTNIRLKKNNGGFFDLNEKGIQFDITIKNPTV